MQAVVALAARYGVDVISRSQEIEGGYPGRKRSIGPTDFADLYWPGGPVVVNPEARRATDDVLATYAIHELGHIVVGGNPNVHDETDGPGLALDFAHFAVAAPDLWDEFMVDFGLPSGAAWGRLPDDVREHYLSGSRRSAIRADLLTPWGDLTFRLGGAA